MNKPLAVAFALVLFLLPVPAGAQATIGGSWRQDVDRFVERVVEAGLVPGLSIAVSVDDWVLHANGFGEADAATGRPVGDGTAFYVASTTKALTATAVALLAERGEIDLDAPVARYVPGLRFREPLDAERVTVEDLLTMTSGLEGCWPVVVRTAFTGEFTTALLLDLLADCGPSDDGPVFAYGNIGYNVLGLVLDPTREHGWKDIVARTVLEPLGATSTTARVSTLDPGRIAMPHTAAPDGHDRIRLAKEDANLHAAGGHFTTAADLARFVAAHASDGLLDGRRVFPAAPIAATHRPRVSQDRTYGPYARHAWGYGWDIATWEGRTILSRFGAFSGYRSHMSFEPATGIGVVVLVNTDGPGSRAADLVASYVYDRLIGTADLDDRYDRRLDELTGRVAEARRAMGDHLAERAARLAPLPHPLEAYAGTYESPAMGAIEWRVIAGGLEARMGVVHSRAEVFDAEANALRIVIGGGTVAAFEIPEGHHRATAVEIRGERFERTRRAPGSAVPPP